MATKVFRFRLKIGSASYVDSSPRWSDETAFATEGQENEMYFREKLNVKLTYQREDFDSIYAAGFDTEFQAELQQQISSVWTTLWTGKFWYTDIDFDVDNRTCIVQPETYDLYEELLGGMEKEFNLIELEPPTVSVQMLKQAVIQVYFPGSSFVANFTNDGIFYETPCTPFNTTPAPGESLPIDNHETLRNDSGFGLGTGYTTPDDGLLNYARVVIPAGSISPDVSGVYYAKSYLASELWNITTNKDTSFTREDGVYAIINELFSGTMRQAIVRVSDGVAVYNTDIQTIPWSPFGQPPHASPNQTFTSLTSGDTVQAYLFMPYVRLLTTKEVVDGNTAIELQDEDPIPHGTFTHAIPIDTLNFIFSEGASTTPTRWGKRGLTLQFPLQYFTKPSSTETLMPVAGTTWTGASAWFWLDDDLRDLQQEGSELITINDAYKLSDCISVLLDEIQPLISHADSTTYSQFLYAATNAIRGTKKVPIIIPKSNVVVGNYDQPAKKAPIRLSEIIKFISFFYNAYWYIGGENLFIIEHENYYHNGKSYTTENVGTDLTAGIEPKTELQWAYRSNKFKYDKTNMPERIETNWMDNVSPQFEGFPIQVLSAYAQKGNIEQRVISKFTSDVDFIHVAASDISKEGFVFLECLQGELYYTVPFVTFVISADESYTMQNGYASLIYAHNQYHKHNLPAESVTLNKSTITATTTKRSKVQDIIFATEEVIDPYELIETNLGVGRVKKMDRQINSNTVKLTIMHDNE